MLWSFLNIVLIFISTISTMLSFYYFFVLWLATRFKIKKNDHHTDIQLIFLFLCFVQAKKRSRRWPVFIGQQSSNTRWPPPPQSINFIPAMQTPQCLFINIKCLNLDDLYNDIIYIPCFEINSWLNFKETNFLQVSSDMKNQQNKIVVQ